MVGRRRRPGLIGTVARTTVVAGTATAVSNSMTRRATNRAMQEQQAQAYQMDQMSAASAPAPSAPAPAGGGSADQLKQLADLHASGALNDVEFANAKAKLLGGG